ncbi:C40 family peptidase [Dactylosporangium sp. NPDC051541]|uniref:C40 family peptidase n=1 Tax=Dactylosporangium sp. NPDC051541 TaxID=3363977 RepID=UPI0037971C39
MCPGPNGEPHLSSNDIRRNLSAATTVCTIACTVLAGAFMSGNTTHAAPPAVVTNTTTTAADAIPDRLLELRGVTRGIPQPPAPPPPVAAPPPAAAPAPPAARAESTRATRDRTRASRSSTRTQRGVRPQSGRPPTRKPARPRAASPAPVGAGYSGDSNGVVGFAMAQVGKGYSFGSTGPNVYDCSGLVFAAFRRLGISLPRSTGGLAGMGRPVSRGELQPGDLVFPSSGHVGIYIGGGRIVHASTERGGVKISPIYAFRFARRVLN